MTDRYFQMLKELSEYQGKDREQLFLKYVEERLNKSYQSYLHDITNGVGYLSRRNEHTVMKKYNTDEKKRTKRHKNTN